MWIDRRRLMRYPDFFQSSRGSVEERLIRVFTGFCVSLRRGEGGVSGHPGQPPRRFGWGRAHRLPVLLRPRDDAADERDHQQQVDRGEPNGRVHVEHLEGVEELPPGTVVLQEGVHPSRVLDPLRQQRSRDRGQGEDEQEDQCHTHRRQLRPGPPAHAEEPELRLRHGRLRGRFVPLLRVRLRT